ncbi:MAG: short-chain dehydrogenase [Methylibium sp. NZG]|nr:MAG: short-chain dehydrogenase [Methylibium sp. NZG]
MSSHLFVLTGASRGLGLAMATQLLSPEHRLLCLSRKTSAALTAEAASTGAGLEQWPIDLAQPLEAAARLQAWLQEMDNTTLSTATLINNAGVIARVGAIDGDSDAALSAALRVTLEAPLLLCAAFLRATREWTAQRRVLNISSGLGRRAMAGSAGYCAAKAGMDHFSRAVALDEAQRARPARIVSLAPGVIDTDMQVQLRSADAAGFPEQGMFIKLKAAGQLSSPQDAAARVLSYLARADFGVNPVADVREA